MMYSPFLRDIQREETLGVFVRFQRQVHIYHITWRSWGGKHGVESVRQSVECGGSIS